MNTRMLDVLCRCACRRREDDLSMAFAISVVCYVLFAR